ncbi:MAG: glycosyltransferase family 2 protein [Thermodesulfobacteriota bacterium]
MEKVSVIIATMNREEELGQCLKSVCEQTVLPMEIVIVDDGASDPDKIRAMIPPEIRFQYHRKAPPGLSASRNLGARVAVGDFLLFLDDDVVLENHYIEAILKAFADDTGHKVGGVSGVITNRRPRPRWFRAWSRFFFLEKDRPGQLFRWGFFSELGIPDRVIGVDWIPGGSSCFRKEVFDKFALSNLNQGGRHGLSDIDFSWRLRGAYELKLTPFARLAHYPPGRGSKEALERGRRQLLNHGLIFRTHGEPNPENWAKFLCASIGVLLGNMGAFALVKEPRERKRRICAAAGNLIGLAQFFWQGG